MRSLTTIAPSVALLVSGMLAALPAQVAAAANAPAKQRLCMSFKMPTLPVTLPKRGMVLAPSKLPVPCG